ncbi:MAG TPA: short-chain dehydrogenase/reductase, partial [Xanthobacteraceae bacterium]|nr:short-chain dehydrogenase/reductase [Xanthobacteraceae bacterium]
MDLKLAGRAALITGGSKGIGLATAKWFAVEDVNLKLVARSSEALQKAADAIRQTSAVEVETMAADLSDAAAREQVAARFPDVDILVNNAGAIPSGSIEAVDDATWRAAWELKMFGYVNMTRLYFARMKARRRGVIINIIGVGGERLDFNYIAGSTGNAGLIAFTRALGGRSPDFGVRVLGVNPGP